MGFQKERERERAKERERKRKKVKKEKKDTKERKRERGDTLLKARLEPTRCVGRVTCASQVVRATACETWQKERDTQRTENTERQKVCIFFF